MVSLHTKRSKPQSVHSGQVQNDPASASTCPDCGGSGFRQVAGGVTRCSCRPRHPEPASSPSPSPSPSPVAACSIPPAVAKNQCERMIARLRERGEKGVTNAEFVAMRIFRYSSRLFENRKKGYDIDAIDLGGGLWLYVLRSEPDILKPLPSFERKARKDLTPPLFASVPGGR